MNSIARAWKRLPRYSTVFWQYVTYIVRQFLKDNCFESASALTYTTLLALVPLMSITVFVMQGIPHFQDLWVSTQQFIFSNFVPATGLEVQQYLQEFINNTSQLSFIGVIFLMSSAMILIYTIEQTFNRIWAVKSTRSVVNTLLLYWLVLTLVPILMGLSFGISTYVWSLPLWHDTAEQLGVAALLITLVTFCLSWLCFAVMYIIIPNTQVNRRDAVICAFIVALAFEISKVLFTNYVASINMSRLLYGAFATIPMFLLWIYILWIIILVGAQMVNAMAFQSFTAVDSSEWRFVQAYKYLIILWHAQQQGKELYAEEIFALEGRMTASEPFNQLDVLESANWIKKTTNGKYVLARDLATVNLYDFYDSLPWRLPNPVMLQESLNIYTQHLRTQIFQVDAAMQNLMINNLSDDFKTLNIS